jgi:hypothetical protein
LKMESTIPGIEIDARSPPAKVNRGNLSLREGQPAVPNFPMVPRLQKIVIPCLLSLQRNFSRCQIPMNNQTCELEPARGRSVTAVMPGCESGFVNPGNFLRERYRRVAPIPPNPITFSEHDEGVTAYFSLDRSLMLTRTRASRIESKARNEITAFRGGHVP